MEQFHNKLSKKLDFYKDWHKSDRHTAVHWAAFLVIAGFLTFLIVAKVSDWDIKGISSHASTAFTCDYYAASDGASSGTGSSSSPWDLGTALQKGSALNTKTLCLRSGVYKGKYSSNLVGATVRSAPGELAKIDGYDRAVLTSSVDSSQSYIFISSADAARIPDHSVVSIHDQAREVDEEMILVNSKLALSGNITRLSTTRGTLYGNNRPHAAGAVMVIGGDALTIQGSDTIYRDFEVVNSDPVRTWERNTDNDIAPHNRGNCIMQQGARTQLINLVVHDCKNGIENSLSANDSLIYGVISYNNGYIYNTLASPINKGAGWVGENENFAPPTNDIRNYNENIAFNNQLLGARLGDSDSLAINMKMAGNVVMNNTLLVGDEMGIANNVNISNGFFYSNSKGTTFDNLKMGYGSTVPYQSMSLVNNYFGIRNNVGSYLTPANLYINRWANATVTGNTFVTTGSVANPSSPLSIISAGRNNNSNYNFSNNTYYDQTQLNNCAGGSFRSVFAYIPSEGVCGGTLRFSE